MNVKDFIQAGEQAVQCSWTDAELDLQLEVLPCVIAYLQARGDRLIIKPLRIELEQFIGFKQSRSERR